VTWNLQSSISRYKIKKTTTTIMKSKIVEQVMSNALMRAFKVTIKILQNDEEVTSIFIITCINNIQINWSLIDNESIIEVISKRLMTKLFNLKIQHDENLSMILNTDHKIILRDDVWMSINCHEIEVYMKTYVCSVIVYDLLLKLRWHARANEHKYEKENLEHHENRR
jgi:hypothetical protein